MKTTRFPIALVAALALLGGLSTAHAATVLTTGNGVIRNSLCVGGDCPNSPAYSDSTILLVENNTRIKFADTSTSSFPNNDWELQANQGSGSGGNRFAINDCGTGSNAGGCVEDAVFVVEAGARTNALYVESDGDIGVGTSNPTGDVHVKAGNTPTLRLEQDGGSGFTPQTWDVAGNEASFFVRDVTGGSTLPFRVRPGTPSNTLYLNSSGVHVGHAAETVSTTLHVERSDGTANILVEEVSGTVAIRPLFTMVNNGPTQFEMQNSASGVNWDFRTNNQDDFTINNPGGVGLALRVDQGTGDVFIAAGQLQVVSSREKKENFTALDPQEILAGVGSLPVTSWSYRKDASGTRHIGPVAEDFHATFGFGANERFLSPSDVSGVALAAIQGLQRAGESKDSRIHDLEQANGELTARLAAIEAALGINR